MTAGPLLAVKAAAGLDYNAGMSNSHAMGLRRLAAAALLTSLTFAGSAQAQGRGGPPRTIPNPETTLLPGGARLEFRSFHSSALGSEVAYSVFTPPSYANSPDRRYPAVYFLHGLFNNHTSWAVERYGNIPAWLDKSMAAGELPEFVLISPSGGRSFYTDSRDGSRRFETLIRQDLVSEAESRFRLRPNRSNRALAGTSMGGYGALKIAMKHPSLFATVAAGSPIVLLGDDPNASLPPDQDRFSQFFGQLISGVFGNPVDPEHWKRNSVVELARSSDLNGLNIYFFYGTNDRYGRRLPLEKGVKELDRILEERGVEHRFELIEGGPHGWELVRTNIEEMFSFLSQTF